MPFTYFREVQLGCSQTCLVEGEGRDTVEGEGLRTLAGSKIIARTGGHFSTASNAYSKAAFDAVVN